MFRLKYYNAFCIKFHFDKSKQCTQIQNTKKAKTKLKGVKNAKFSF